MKKCNETLAHFIASNECPKCEGFDNCMERLIWLSDLWMRINNEGKVDGK